jgi:ABC-type dipeptide/oligopeptide/nickel transport system permease subunit
VAVLVIWWPTCARVARSQIPDEEDRPYVEALGATH